MQPSWHAYPQTFTNATKLLSGVVKKTEETTTKQPPQQKQAYICICRHKETVLIICYLLTVFTFARLEELQLSLSDHYNTSCMEVHYFLTDLVHTTALQFICNMSVLLMLFPIHGNSNIQYCIADCSQERNTVWACVYTYIYIIIYLRSAHFCELKIQDGSETTSIIYRFKYMYVSTFLTK